MGRKFYQKGYYYVKKNCPLKNEKQFNYFSKAFSKYPCCKFVKAATPGSSRLMSRIADV